MDVHQHLRGIMLMSLCFIPHLNFLKVVLKTNRFLHESVSIVLHSRQCSIGAAAALLLAYLCSLLVAPHDAGAIAPQAGREHFSLTLVHHWLYQGG